LYNVTVYDTVTYCWLTALLLAQAGPTKCSLLTWCLLVCLLTQAQEERQLLEQIKEELQKARQQVEQQRKRQSTSPAAAQQGVPAAKCCVALQERLSHKKQQLDEAVSRYSQ
jgi:hypothetical protein